MRRNVFLCAALLTAAGSAGELALDGAYARWGENAITIGNAHFARSYRLDGDVLRTVSFAARDAQPVAADPSVKAKGTFAVEAEVDRSSPVGAPALNVRLRWKTGSKNLVVYPDAAGPLVLEPKRDLAKAGAWRNVKHGAFRAATDVLPLVPRRVRVTSFEFLDRTDVTDELVFSREWLLSSCEQLHVLAGTALDMRDVATGDGVVCLRLAPMPASRPEPVDDFLFAGGFPNAVATLPNGYPVAELAYRGGDVGRTRVLHAFQRCLRAYRPGRDGVFLTNTWGDGNRDSRINEKFLLEEVAAGAELGVDVIQIDDGWQKGRSANSAAKKKRDPGAWGRYWDLDPAFWQPCPERFPGGLDTVVSAAKRKGLQFGLWFGPDSSDDFRHWNDDADCLLTYFRTLGIRYFKIDSVTIRSGRALDRQRALFDRMLRESGGEMTFDLDCTTSVRPGYFGLMNIGPLFVENRYIRAGDRRLWHPERTLRNLWKLSTVIDPVRLRMEVLNPRRLPELYGDDPLAPAKWPADAIFAIAMTASPLGWFEISNLASETVAAMKPLIATWKTERANLHGGVTHAVGQAPDGHAWTGFVTEAADGAGGYALLFREASEQASHVLDLSAVLPGAESCAVLGGRGAASVEKGVLSVRVPSKLDFIWIRVR